MGYAATKAWRQRHPNIKAYRAEEARKWREAHPQLSKEIRDRHRENNIESVREKDREAHKRWRRNNPEAQRIRVARFRAKREVELSKVAGRPRPSICDLCNQPSTKPKGIVFDHCHAKGHFRGWICDRCNKVLGLVYDDSQLLEKMANYLKGKLYGEVDGESQKES